MTKNPGERTWRSTSLRKVSSARSSRSASWHNLVEKTYASVEDLIKDEIPAERMGDGGSLFDFGYCCTVHKFQGGQADHVVFYVDRAEDGSDDTRRLLYTAVARASNSAFEYFLVLDDHGSPRSPSRFALRSRRQVAFWVSCRSPSFHDAYEEAMNVARDCPSETCENANAAALAAEEALTSYDGAFGMFQTAEQNDRRGHAGPHLVFGATKARTSSLEDRFRGAAEHELLELCSDHKLDVGLFRAMANAFAEVVAIMTTRGSWNDYFMAVANTVATRSTCDRKHVGAVIVRGQEHPRDTATTAACVVSRTATTSAISRRMVTCVRTVHAEANALVQAARHGVRVDGNATIYVSANPCWGCFRLIVNAGIVTIHYGESEYRMDDRIFEAAKTLGVELSFVSAASP